MDIFDFLILLFIIFLILLSGFLSGSETAITAVSKPRIISKINQGSKRASFVKKLIDTKENVISSLLLSNNLELSIATSLILFIRLTTIWFYTLLGFIALKLTIKR